MKWSTEVAVPPGPYPIGYGSSVLLMGSCFATHMGDRLRHYQFREETNPLGVIYHPAPLLELLHRAVDDRGFEPGDVFEWQGVWRSLWAHSSLAGPDRDAALDALNKALGRLRDALHSASHCILTLGTARAHRHRDTGRLVANCQKLPAREFVSELSGVGDLQEWIGGLVRGVRRINPDCHCILTVSPVRHLRDGLVENQRSKAHLIAAVHAVTGEQGVSYFPAYEILMDELRDYRFYDRDLVHPNAMAVDHIWDRFSQAWIAPEALAVMKEVDAVRKALAHRPLHPESAEHESFKKSLRARIAYLIEQYPHMSF